ncbi:MAG TPA: insulinase family protein [Bacteroidales bacterium]|nr:insulinase family protein [Bacteroidales bacterium]
MKKRTLFSIVILFLSSFLTAQQLDLSQKVPFDPQIRTGKLANGMTYYIKHNEEPKERASFYFIQNVGALLEQDNQNGLAHFLEHMAFNGTKHFEGKGILNFLEKNGVAFGSNINAYTSQAETVYNLSDVPTTKPGLVDSCLLVMHDWSDYLLLTNEEIDAERGVISEEWRTRRNASFRLRSQMFPVLFKGSKYAVRDVIGDLDVIKNFEYETLRQFYYQWYRSDLQAVVVVGDIDVDQVEAKVKSLFSKIKKVKNAPKRDGYQIPTHDEPYYVLATDKEAAQSSIAIYVLHNNKDEQAKTLKDMRDTYITNLYNTMFALRIAELLQKGTPPFINAQSGFMPFVRYYNAFAINVTANPNQEEIALEAILTEVERVKRFGFTATELERAKSNLLTQMESAYKQKDKISNNRYCREIQQHFLTLAPTPGFDYEMDFIKKVLPGISVEEISAKAKEWIVDKNKTIIVSGPSEGAKHLTESEVHSIIDKVKNAEIAPYVDKVSAASLISEPLKGSKIIFSKKLTEFDAVEWKLGNKVKVIYRHADYENDAVSVLAYSKGGSSLFDDSYIPSSTLFEQFVDAYGVGDFDAISLQKMLTGKKVELSPTLGDLTEGFSGSSTPKDIETMLQLVYLYFEKPRFDAGAHDALKGRYAAFISNLANDPQKIMQDSLSLILSNYHPRTKIMNAEFINEVNLKRVQEIYQDRFQDASDFTFFIVGNIDEQTLKPLVEKYIGSLSDINREENWKDNKVKAPKGTTQKEIELALATPKSNVNVVFDNEMDYSQRNKLGLAVLNAVLDLRFTETIREEEGGSYGVGVNASLSHFPESGATLSLFFDCDPEKANHLKAILYKEIEKIKQNGPTVLDLDKSVKNILKTREQSKLHNAYWMNSLYSFYFDGINTNDSENYEKILSSFTPKDIQEITQVFFENADVIEVVFKPKAK